MLKGTFLATINNVGFYKLLRKMVETKNIGGAKIWVGAVKYKEMDGNNPDQASKKGKKKSSHGKILSS